MSTVTRIEKQQAVGRKRVAAYCRVSTDKDAQLESLENQMAAFRFRAAQRGDWDLVSIYADVDTPYGRNTKANQQSILTIHLLFNLDINTSTVSTWPEFDQLMSDGQSQILRLREHVHAYRLRR